MAPDPDGVSLRGVEPGDLPRLFEMQLDPEANRVAATVPRTAAAFDAHWAAVLRDPAAVTRAILRDGEVVGTVGCFRLDGVAYVGYWVAREHWGKGVATRALRLLLEEVPARPLHARAATANASSLRVLEKCGFTVERVEAAPASDRYLACEEAVLVLRD